MNESECCSVLEKRRDGSGGSGVSRSCERHDSVRGDFTESTCFCRPQAEEAVNG